MSGHGGRHHAHPTLGHLLWREFGEFGLDFVIKPQAASMDHFIVFEPKTQQHGLFNPLVGGPLTHTLACGHSQAPSVQFGQHVVDRFEGVLGCLGGAELAAVFPGLVDGGFKG